MSSDTAKININSLFNKYKFKEYEEENLEN